MPNAGKYKWRLLQGKGLQIQINNKTTIEFPHYKLYYSIHAIT